MDQLEQTRQQQSLALQQQQQQPQVDPAVLSELEELRKSKSTQEGELSSVREQVAKQKEDLEETR